MTCPAYESFMFVSVIARVALLAGGDSDGVGGRLGPVLPEPIHVELKSTPTF